MKNTNPYLTIVNARTKYNPKDFEELEYEQIAVTDGDWGKSMALIEKNTKLAYDKVLEDFERFGIKCKLMSARRSNFDQIYAQGETFAVKLNKSAKEELEKESQSVDSKASNPSAIKKLATILKHPKLIKIAHDYQKTYAARLGHSEHHTGLAIDISVNMNDVEIPDKIREKHPNASQGELNFLTRRLIMEKHGFVLTYPQASRLEEATGMKNSEGWHWRYIGAEHSQRIAKIRERVEQNLSSKGMDKNLKLHEIFLEDYVKLLEYDVEVSNEEELLDKYAEIFEKEILQLGTETKDGVSV